MLKKLFVPLLASTLMALSAAAAGAQADASSPDGLVKAVVSDVMASVKADKDIQAGNIPKIVALVDQKIVPYTNFQKTTQLVMGRAWSQATPQQQAQITEEFKKLLVRTYAGAISQIRDQTVQYRPFRAAATDTDVVVRTQVINNGEPIQLDYRLEKTAAGWRVYDINVLGAWLIEAYRSQFSQLVSQSGVDGLLKFLQDRNRQLAAAK